MNLLEIYKELKSDLRQIEDELHRSLTTPNLQLKEASEHLLRAGGKRIRPVFVLLGGQTGSYDLERLTSVAVALELIHMATLVHDDVIDNAHLRRGQLTVRSKWDNRMAMYTGDYIFAKALHYATQLKDPRIHQILAKSIVDMCVGEIEQIRSLFHWNQSLKTYLLRIKRKTALLMAVSCQLGGLACRATDQESRALYRFGYYVGMAFQITDDILDFTGTEKELGKPAGSDLLQGNITLPVLASFKENPAIQQRVMAQFEQDREPDMPFIIALIKETGGIQLAQKVARRYLTKAREVLQELSHTKTKKTFLQITQFIEHRNF